VPRVCSSDLDNDRWETTPGTQIWMIWVPGTLLFSRSACRTDSAFGGELAKPGNRGPLTLRDGHSADSGASEHTSRVSNPDLTSALTLR